MLFSALIVGVIDNYKFNRPQHNLNNVNAVGIDFSETVNEVLTEDEYNNNSSFTITGLQQFLNFNYNLLVKGRDFSGKYVCLNSDIDLGGTPWCPNGKFAGQFDGGNHTITGAGKTMSNTGNNDAYYGTLFAALCGSKWTQFDNMGNSYDVYPCVTRLRLKDFKYDNVRYWGDSGALAAAVYGDMQISQISVEDFTGTFHTSVSVSSDDMGCGAIAGSVPYGESANVLIYDCEIININLTTETSGDYAAIVGSIESLSDTTACTIRNCIVNGWSITVSNSSATVHSNTYANCYKVKGNTLKGYTSTQVDINSAPFVSLSTCYNSKGTSISSFEGLNNNYSSVTSKTSGTWFYDSTFNGGFPKLQNWLTIDAKFEFYYANKIDDKEQLGYVEESDNLDVMEVYEKNNNLYTLQPNQLTIVYDPTEDTIKIGDKEVKAVPKKEGYEFAGWFYESTTTNNDLTIYKYTATFKLKTHTLQFSNITKGLEEGEASISPSSTKRYPLIYGTLITETFSDGKLKYEFKNSSNTSCSVTYTIPDKYKLKSGTTGTITITQDTTIEPEVEIKTYKVIFTGDVHTSNKTNRSLKVSYGDSVSYTIDLTNSKLEFMDGRITYTPEGNYKLDEVKINNNTIKYEELNSLGSELGKVLNQVTCDVTITPIYCIWYNVTFKAVENTTQPKEDKTVSLKGGTTINTNNNTKTLTYTYNNNVVEYKASEFYVFIIVYSGVIEVNKNLEIKPIVQFQACEVTVANINSYYGTRKVLGDSYGIDNDGLFAVEFGSKVLFNSTLDGSGIFTYTYKFMYNNTVTQIVEYTMSNAKYSMRYEINSGKRGKILNGIDGEGEYEFKFNNLSTDKEYSINPTFGNRQIIITFKSVSNTNQDEYRVIKYDSNIQHTSIPSGVLTFTYTDETIGESTKVYTADGDYQFDDISIKVNNTNGTLDNLTNITNDLEIQPTCSIWYSVTFVAIGNTSSPQENIVYNMPLGSDISCSTEKHKLIYTLTNAKDSTQYTVTYNANEYYVIKNNLTGSKVNSPLTITPTTEFYACTVTMGNISSEYGTRIVTGDSYGTANDGVFVVEFETTVRLTITADKTTHILTYTYTFSSGQIVTYKMLSNKYAIKYDLDNNGNRTKIYDGLTCNINTTTYTFEYDQANKESSKIKTISPTFGKKQYHIELD